MRSLLTLLLLFPTLIAFSNVTVSVSPSICGRPTGSVFAHVSGGVPPYTYMWSNGSTYGYQDGLYPGIYDITVTDSQGMQFIGQGEVLVQSSYNGLGGTPQPLMHCPGQPAMAWVYLGMDQLGVPPPITHPVYGPHPYSFWHPGLFGQNDVVNCQSPSGIHYMLLTFDPLLAGSFLTVDFADGAGCPGQTFFSPGGPMVWPNVQPTNVQPSCQNMNNGSITLSVQGQNTSGDFSVYSYKDGTPPPSCAASSAWPFLAGESGSFTINGLAPGDYWIVTTNDAQHFSGFVPAVSQYFCKDSILVNVPLNPVDCGSVTGRLFIDNNGNCAMNGGENRIPSTVIEFTPGPHYATTNSTGYYSIDLPFGSYTAAEQHPVYVQSCPAMVTVSTGNSQGLNVGCAGGQPLDVQTSLGNGPARPGFELQYGIALNNLTDGSTGTVTLTMTIDPTLSFISSSLPPSSIIGNVITWTSPALILNQPFQHRSIQVRTQVPPNVGLIGTTLNTQVTLATQNTDNNVANNTATSAQIVTGSYDPNDKLATTTSGSDAVYYIDTDEWIDYTLRFQNTGTDTAFNVIITDTLPAALDATSIQWGVTSHTASASLVDDGVVKFTFSNILLPDSSANEPESHGFASFRIKPVGGLAVGANIANEANIFFDFNPPIITPPSVLVTALTPIRLPLRLALGGCYDDASGLMEDDLRTAQLLPAAQPYSMLDHHAVGFGAAIVTDGSVLDVMGNDAIVDWVVVELRDATGPAQVVWSRYGLLQRDGDVVDLDGSSDLGFGATQGSYYVAVKHRNHLGAMTATAIPLTGASSSIDLTSSNTSTWGIEAREDRSGTMVLWPGNVTFNNEVKYAGEGNDRDPILVKVGGSILTNVIQGYATEDVNMNGEIRYTGATNDRDPILVTIGGSVPTAVRNEQIP